MKNLPIPEWKTSPEAHRAHCDKIIASTKRQLDAMHREGEWSRDALRLARGNMAEAFQIQMAWGR